MTRSSQPWLRSWWFVLGMLLGVLLSACASPSLPQPPDALPESYAGLWVGTATDNVGRGDVEMVLVQSGDRVTGEALLTFSVGVLRRTAAGTVRGVIEEHGLELWITPENPDYCPYAAALERSGDLLEGSYRGVGCRGEIEGDLTLRKQ